VAGSPGLRAEMGRKGKERFEAMFARDKAVGSYAKLYGEMMGSKE